MCPCNRLNEWFIFFIYIIVSLHTFEKRKSFSPLYPIPNIPQLSFTEGNCGASDVTVQMADGCTSHLLTHLPGLLYSPDSKIPVTQLLVRPLPFGINFHRRFRQVLCQLLHFAAQRCLLSPSPPSPDTHTHLLGQSQLLPADSCFPVNGLYSSIHKHRWQGGDLMGWGSVGASDFPTHSSKSCHS